VSAMTAKDLKRLLQALEDTDEVVLQRAAPGFELLAAWRAARDAALRAACSPSPSGARSTMSPTGR
jgi:hypothetical protein